MNFSKGLTEKILQLLGSVFGHELLNRVKANSVSPVDATGTATGIDAYVITFNPPITNLKKFDRFYVDFEDTNTGVATLDTDGIGAISLKKQGKYGLAPADIKTTLIYEIFYDGTNFQINI